MNFIDWRQKNMVIEQNEFEDRLRTMCKSVVKNFSQDHLPERLVAGDVSIVAWSLLPESKRHLAGSFPDR